MATATVIDLAAAKAQRIASRVASHGSLDTAILAAHVDFASDEVRDLLAEKARLAEAADPALKAARLILAAGDIEARAKPIMAEGADWAGKAAGRRLLADTYGGGPWAQAERDQAAIFEVKSQVCEALGRQYMEAAWALKLQASDIMAGLTSIKGVKDAIGEVLALTMAAE
jgi:hypothetical protein